MKKHRTATVYALLVAVWALLAAWQMIEHRRVRDAAQASLLTRARAITLSLGVVIRSQAPFGIVRQPRLEAALKELVKSSELLAVTLLNTQGKVVASAGRPIELDMAELPERGYSWGKGTLTVVNPVDLGLSLEEAGTTRPVAIVLPDDDAMDSSDTIHFRAAFTSGALAGPPPWIPRPDGRITSSPAGVRPDSRMEQATSASAAIGFPGQPRDGEREPGRRPRRPGRPPWLTEKMYLELSEKHGLHGCVLLMRTDAVGAEVARDLWLRLLLMGITWVAVAGLGLAWRNLERSSQLELRLTRASAINTQLREMNIAAAGLAHETRNPLNIVRGLAQLVSHEENASPDVRQRAGDILKEVDRVAGRLNEFIDYSKPRQARPAPTNLHAVVREVERALETDKEDKAIEFLLSGPDLAVEADESLLRQALFNLLLNAIQAVDRGGRVEVAIEKTTSDEARLEVRDNGPGVPSETREEIFQPYFTTHERGTGLGLAVVRQIVLAHHWEIEYIPGENAGSIFRISGLSMAPRPGER